MRKEDLVQPESIHEDPETVFTAIDQETTSEATEIRRSIAERLGDTETKLDEAMRSRNRQRDELISQAGIHDTATLHDLEQKAAEINNRYARLKKYISIMVLSAVPLALAAKHKYAETPAGLSSYEKRAEAEKQLQEEGITDERKFAYTKGVSETLYNTVSPVGYSGNPIGNVERISFAGPFQYLIGDRKYMADIIPERDDAWRLYLGLPQQHGTFGVSAYRPERSKQDKYYYKINDWLHKVFRGKNLDGTLQTDADFIRNLVDIVKSDKLKKGETKPAWAIGSFNVTRHNDNSVIIESDMVKADEAKVHEKGKCINGVMGQYKLSYVKDASGSYLSYYDRWNLEGSPEGENGLLGKPYEIYDRIYFDPVTYEPLSRD